MRERLVEILKKYEEQPCGVLDGVGLWADDIADYLLAEGVIVPPCKVGDTVFALCEDFGSIFECKIHSTDYIDSVWTGHMRNTWIHARGSLYCWIESDFGKTVFLTKEEAEKALAEREGKE